MGCERWSNGPSGKLGEAIGVESRSGRVSSCEVDHQNADCNDVTCCITYRYTL
jgi:hypothetical protein